MSLFISIIKDWSFGMFIDCVALCDFEIPFDHLTSRTLTWVFYFNNTFWILLFVSYNLMVTFFGGEWFWCSHFTSTFLADGREDNYVSASDALLAGMVAGAIETFISSPFELIKLRAQVTSASYVPSSTFALEKGAQPPLISRLLRGCYPDKRSLNQYVGLISTLTTKNTNVTSALLEYPWAMTGCGRPPSVCNVTRPSDIISLEGWSTLWRGLRSGIVRDSVFGGVFFSSWQFLHQAMLDWKAVGMNPPPRFISCLLIKWNIFGIIFPANVVVMFGLMNDISFVKNFDFGVAKLQLMMFNILLSRFPTFFIYLYIGWVALIFRSNGSFSLSPFSANYG